jgi:hypothetical protein
MAEDQDEDEIEYLTRQQALTAAQRLASRDFNESESLISYVAYVPGLFDFCHCEFRQFPRGWLGSYRMLEQNERQPEEQITDERICAAGGSGNIIAAIRLCRAKYGVGLAEGKARVEELLFRRNA